jgi:hypothetical protein
MLEASSTLFTCQTARTLGTRPMAQGIASAMPILRPHRSDGCPPLAAALVEADGIEPTTPCLQSRCSPTELRPLVLSSQLAFQHSTRAVMVGPGRFELPTSRLSSARSNQLSYEPGSFPKILSSKPGSSRARTHDCARLSIFGSGRDTPAAAWLRSISGPGGPALEPRHRASAHLPVDLRELHPSVGVFGRSSEGVSAFMTSVLRKEVIQPQVPLRLPCYDFTPVADLTVDGCILAVCAPA